jgi:hypothetical protein
MTTATSHRKLAKKSEKEPDLVLQIGKGGDAHCRAEYPRSTLNHHVATLEISSVAAAAKGLL